MPAVSTIDQNTARFLKGLHPYDTLPDDLFEETVSSLRLLKIMAGGHIYQYGEQLEGLYIITDGAVEIRAETGTLLSSLSAKNSFGERGLMRDGTARNNAGANAETTLLLLPASQFHKLCQTQKPFSDFFNRSRSNRTSGQVNIIASRPVADLMTEQVHTCPPTTSIRQAARLMETHEISSLLITEDERLLGILTLKDIVKKTVATGGSIEQPVADIMTRDPLTLPPTAIGSDVLHLMIEKGIAHVPIMAGETLRGIITQTDLTRYQMLTSASLLRDITRCSEIADLSKATSRIPQLLANLVGTGSRHDIVTRLITDIADGVTRHLLTLAERKFGPPPAPYLWLACGSEGRQEQTGVSDQDNCLIFDDAATLEDRAYFKKLARFVSDGLNDCGYVYCPGDMMATNDRWCQPLSVWRSYFESWINSPVKEAQMLASVMFDLRPIGGQTSLYTELKSETMQSAAANSIFIAHMISNSVGHTPPLGLIGGITTLRSGEHKHHIDLKHNGVIPVVDLGRIYALQGQIEPVNTRARLCAAKQQGIISAAGGQDLIDAYDLIAETRLQHQARQIRRGEAPDNFMRPTSLSAFERSHLRDAFVVVRTMQAALTQGRNMI